MFDESNIPRKVKVARARAAFTLAEFRNVNVISTVGFANRVQGLMDVGNKVHKKFQGFGLFRTAGSVIRENPLKCKNLINHAIVPILNISGTHTRGARTIARLRETVGVPGNVHEMPEVSFAALVFDLVGPSRNCGKIVVAKEIADSAFRHSI
jgi:hypothetical protein